MKLENVESNPGDRRKHHKVKRWDFLWTQSKLWRKNSIPCQPPAPKSWPGTKEFKMACVIECTISWGRNRASSGHYAFVARSVLRYWDRLQHTCRSCCKRITFRSTKMIKGKNRCVLRSVESSNFVLTLDLGYSQHLLPQISPAEATSSK